MDYFELLPIRCITCSHVLGRLDSKLEALKKTKMPMDQILDELGIPKHKTCCRAAIMHPAKYYIYDYDGRTAPPGILSKGRLDKVARIDVKEDLRNLATSPSGTFIGSSLVRIDGDVSVETEKNIISGTEDDAAMAMDLEEFLDPSELGKLKLDDETTTMFLTADPNQGMQHGFRRNPVTGNMVEFGTPGGEVGGPILGGLGKQSAKVTRVVKPGTTRGLSGLKRAPPLAPSFKQTPAIPAFAPAFAPAPQVGSPGGLLNLTGFSMGGAPVSTPASSPGLPRIVPPTPPTPQPSSGISLGSMLTGL